jgi:HK97 family phage portal protein
MIKRIVKALNEMIHGRGIPWVMSLLPNTKFDYAREVGDGISSNVVMAPVLWIARNFPEAKIAVKQTNREGEEVVNQQHPLAKLVNNPNPFYSGDALWMGTLFSFCLDGNAYWLKVKGTRRQPSELWYVPHWHIEPKWEGRDFISYYEYRPGGTEGMIRLAPEDVVHFRYGIDPRNVRKGLAPLGSAMREIFMDNEASNYVAGLLRNAGIPGLIITPEKDVSISPEDVEVTKNYIKTKFTGDHRGEPMVLGAATRVQEFGLSPDKMDLSGIRNLTEERVCALLGIPAAIVGFGTGIEQTKVGATMEEMRRLAWTGGIIPMQTLMAADLTRSLLPDFSSEGEVVFDDGSVRAMQDDLDKQSERINRAVSGGWMMVSEARKMAGLEVLPEHEIFLRPVSAFETGPAAEEVEQTPPVLQNVQAPPPAEDGAKANKRMTRLQSRIARTMDRVRKQMEPAFRRKIEKFLDDLGKDVERLWLRIAKQDSDELRVRRLFEQINVPERRTELRGIFGSHYVAVHNEVMSGLGNLGLGVRLPDSVQLEILSFGGTRAGLVGMTEDATQKALGIVRAAREEDLGVPEVARRLRDAIPAGPWSSSKIRADVIARTETRFAQTESALRAYAALEGAGEMVMILDARLGETDEECMEINGAVVTIAEARQSLAEEHPNGTRDIVPVFTGREA